MSEEKKDEVELNLGKLLFFMIGTIVVILSIGFIATYHTESVRCANHVDMGFNTEMKGDIFYPECFIKVENSSKFIPLNKLGQVGYYNQMA